MTRGAKWLALGALTVFVVIGLAVRLPHQAALATGGALVSVGAGLLLVRSPPRYALPCAALATAGVAIVADSAASNVGWFAICVLAAWCVVAGGRRPGLVYWGGSLLLFGAEWLSGHADRGWGAWIAGVTFTALAAGLVRHELDLVAQLRAAQAGLAERSRAEERNRIARDLHDVIAHTLTVSLLHVSSARLAVEFDPADASRSLAEAERLGRQSLTEVRSIMGSLRWDGQDGSPPPVPGIDDVGELIDRFKAAGADVALTRRGDTDRLPATIGTTVYRIVQEALTNAAKHAPGERVTVQILAAAERVEARIESSGAPGQGSGMGLLTMRERAEAVGGSCTAGAAGCGWRVDAILPAAGPHPGVGT
ncbi:MAG: histidine kinase [Actinomycetota bacterium]|nr:histidine kinase [Actinomycetota bacterium]